MRKTCDAAFKARAAFEAAKREKTIAHIASEFSYTPIEKREANLLFSMISEPYEKVPLIVTSNKSFESWAEMMGDTVMITALLDRLLHHARVFTLDGESYRIKKSRKEV
jgi:DNA replication protein DnaC